MSKRVLLSLLVLAGVVFASATASAHGNGTTARTASGRDRDGDRLPDRWERRYHLSTRKRSGKRDPDHDGLRNRREFRLRLNPRRRDTDRDGLSDGAEVKRYHTNPRRRDTDGDGLLDGAEVKRYHTNPRLRDTDHDGFSDGEEVRSGSNPQNPASQPIGTGSQPSAPAPIPGPSDFPNASNTGVPAGWTPAQTRSTDMTVGTPGTVVQDVLLTNGAGLYITAPNVTVRRVKLDGGWINNVSGQCANGLVLEDVTIDRGNGESAGGEGVVSYGGYTARRVAILNRSEGFRSGARGAGCGPSTIQDSFIQIRPPDPCGDWHGDGIQGYDSSGVTIRNVTIDFGQGQCGGTAGFFYPGGPDGTPDAFADINRLLIKGGPYPFRLGTRGSVQGLKIVNNSWDFGPILITDAGCGAISPWEAKVVEVDSAFNVTRTVRAVACH
jgi:hypothetical protein